MSASKALLRFGDSRLVVAAVALVGCGAPTSNTDVDAGVTPVDRGVVVEDSGGPTRVDTSVARPETGAMDAGSAPADTGPLVEPDVGTVPPDVGCFYDPVTADRNGEPRDGMGHIRWCWPGEPACFCDSDNDCYRQAGYAPRCSPGGAGFDAGGPRDSGNVGPRDVPVAPPVDTGPVTANGTCTDPVPATTTGPTITLDTIRFNWSMQCYRPEDGSLFVFVEDTEREMVALRFYDFLNNGGPATGTTVDLAGYRIAARPFFVSGLSGIETEPEWRAARSYLAYEGQVVFNQLQRTNPVGTRLRMEFRNVRLREVRQYTNGRCENVTNGARMVIRSLTLDLPINNIHTNEDCVDWAGG